MAILFTCLYAIVVFSVLIAGFIYTYYHYKLGVGSAPSSATARAAMAVEIKSLGSVKTIVDMGSGTGGLVRALAGSLPDTLVTGLDLSPPAHFVASLARKIFGPQNTQFLLRDFKNYDLSNTDAVVMYLTANVQNSLSAHFKANLPPHAVVLCLNEALPDTDWQVYKTIETGHIIEPKLYCHRAKTKS